jgi:glycosyltransferase involved in cell wall biosynthesis
MKLSILGSANSIHTVKWANYFMNHFENVTIYSFDERSPNLNPDIEVFCVNQRFISFKFLFDILQIRKLLKSNPIKLFHVHSLGSYAFLSFCLGLKDFYSTPWGSDILLNKNILKKFFLIYALRRSYRVTCDSRLILDMLKNMGIKTEIISIINFGIDTSLYSKFDSLHLNSSLEISKKTNIVLSTRSLEPVYDVECLVKSAPFVLRDNPDTKFVIVGSGSQKQFLENLVDKLDLANHFIFMGKVENFLLPQILNSSTVYVSTATSDAGIASSTAEAMSCELICIVSDVRENSDWVIDGVSGFTFEPSNPNDLASKIIMALNISNENKTIGKAARKMIMDRNDYHNEMEKMLHLYYEYKFIDNE